MTGLRVTCCLLLLCIVPLGAIVRPIFAAEPRDVSPEQIRTAIERGVAFLKDRQDKVRGNWQELPENTYAGGVTSLCTLALLNSGEKARDPVVTKALDSLRGLGRPEKTYTTSLQTMVLCIAEPDKDRELIRRNVKWLEGKQLKEGEDKGCWTYGDHVGAIHGDPSNTHFALMALDEAASAGIDVDGNAWTLAIEYWKRKQIDDGSWAYEYNNGPVERKGRGSMTCAGISSLMIARKHIRGGDATAARGAAEEAGKEPDEVNRAVRWLAKQKDLSTRNAGMSQERLFLFYYLDALSGAGRVTGRQLIGECDWYRDGATELVRLQDALSGQWGEKKSFETPEVATAFAIRFLSLGRSPRAPGQPQLGP